MPLLLFVSLSKKANVCRCSRLRAGLEPAPTPMWLRLSRPDEGGACRWHASYRMTEPTDETIGPYGAERPCRPGVTT